MKYWYLILFSFLVIVLFSCNDVIESDPGYIKEKVSDSTEIYKKLEYNFYYDNLNYLPGDSTIIFRSKTQSTWSKMFTIVYKGSLDSIIIKKLSLESSKYFEIKFLYGDSLNFILKKNQVNKFFNPIIYLSTENLAPGIYKDQLYINDDKKTGITIIVYVE